MLFLPKSRERYLSALRLHLQKKYLRHGADAAVLHGLRQVTLHGLSGQDEPAVPTDLRAYCDTLLGAAAAVLLQKGFFVPSELSPTGVRMMPRTGFSVLVLLLMRQAAGHSGGRVCVSARGQSLTLTVPGIRPDAAAERLIRQLHGTCLYRTNAAKTLVILPAPKTKSPGQPVPDEWHYLLDPLSPVYLFFSDLPSRSGR